MGVSAAAREAMRQSAAELKTESFRVGQLVGHLALAAAPLWTAAHAAHAATTVPLQTLDGALLAWLAIEGPTSRARLAALLWPDNEPADARNNLRQRLFQLKKQLGLTLVDGTTTLALAEGVTHDLFDGDSVLGDAGRAFDGELGAWLVQQRERRMRSLSESLAELSELAEKARDYGDALAHATEALAMEPMSEAAHRRVMRLHYLRNDRAAALRAFDHCERLLKDEVGTRPSADTLALLATIESAKPDETLQCITTVPAALQRPPRLIGRDAERQALRHALEAGVTLLMTGSAGMGKSRLIADLLERHAGVGVGVGVGAVAGVRTASVSACARPGDAAAPHA